MMLQSLKVERFKNLKELDIDFRDHNGLSLVIGNNASGKSNFLELFSEIFYSQYSKQKFDTKYNLKYLDFNKKLVEVDSSSISEDLPKRVVAVYSGEEDRLWKSYYEKLYLNYVKEITGDKAIDFPKMLYLNKYYWEISLLCLILSNAEDVQLFIKETLGIESIKTITFVKVDPEFKNSSVKSFVDSLNETYELNELKEFIGEDPDLFLKLFIAVTDKSNKLISEIKIVFNDDFNLSFLSEGQKKQLLIKAALEYAGQEDTLFLLDEPDAYIHISNKKTLFEIINPYVSNRHIILTTHSPTLCKICENKSSIILLENGEYKLLNQEFEAAKYLVNGSDIYKLLFSKKHIIIVEGKTDDRYLSKAIELFANEYPLLEFDYLRVGGTDEENIKNLLDKIQPFNGRKIIVLVDRDDAGFKVYKKLFPTSNSERKDIDFKLIKEDTYFLIAPHKNGNDSTGDFMIEDYFTSAKILQLAIIKLQEEFTENVSFGKFPSIKEKLKSTHLPSFCDAASKDDMEGFKILLDKLSEIVQM